MVVLLAVGMSARTLISGAAQRPGGALRDFLGSCADIAGKCALFA